MPIAFEEMQGYPKETSGPNYFRAMRQLKCAWGDRFALGQQLNGVEYPYTPNTGAYPITIDSQPMDGEVLGAGSVASYEFAIINVEYSTPEVSGGATLFEYNGYQIAESIEATVEFLTIAPDRFQWQNGDGTFVKIKEAEAPGAQIRGFDWVYQKFNVEQVNPDIALVLPGMVNDSALTSPSLGLSFAQETLFFHAPSIVRKGDAIFDLTYRFTFRKNTWNKFFRGETGLYEYMYKDGVVFKPIELGSFDIL